MINLHHAIFWIVMGVFVTVGILLSYTLVRLQQKSNNAIETDRLGLIWTLVPVGILAALLILTFQTIHPAR